jgi:5-methylcytosine-specific restriction endonuclease McrA
VSKPCLHCGNPVPDRGPKRVAAAKFCSNACKFAAQRARSALDGTGRLTKACEVCGTKFSYYASVRPQAAYCSASCKSTGHSRRLYGVLSPSGKGSTYRKGIRGKFLDRCALCGWNEGPNDVAHIVARKDGGANTFENVIMLCPNHHRLFDSGQIAVEAIRAARPNCLP